MQLSAELPGGARPCHQVWPSQETMTVVTTHTLVTVDTSFHKSSSRRFEECVSQSGHMKKKKKCKKINKTMFSSVNIHQWCNEPFEPARLAMAGILD